MGLSSSPFHLGVLTIASVKQKKNDAVSKAKKMGEKERIPYYLRKQF